MESEKINLIKNLFYKTFKFLFSTLLITFLVLLSILLYSISGVFVSILIFTICATFLALPLIFYTIFVYFCDILFRRWKINWELEHILVIIFLGIILIWAWFPFWISTVFEIYQILDVQIRLQGKDDYIWFKVWGEIYTRIIKRHLSSEKIKLMKDKYWNL
jgi:hypothetical protein